MRDPERAFMAAGICGLALLMSACSVKTYAINMVGNALASGQSVYETDDDLELVGAALPFGLKLTESLLTQSPRNEGLLFTACRGFVLYSYAYVDYAAQLASSTDLDRARALRTRARRLYLRAFGYGIRGLELKHQGFGQALEQNPRDAVQSARRYKSADVPWLYWTAASLGLAIAASTDDAGMLARLPEVHALLDRALELDEGWNAGALHEFKIVLAGASPGDLDAGEVRRHYERALELSGGRSPSAHLAYAEAVSVPQQNREEFRTLIERVTVINPDVDPATRFLTLLAQRRAGWLASHMDDLILAEPAASPTGRN